MKVKIRVKIQDEEEQYPDIAKAENYNKDEIIELLSNENGSLKRQLSAFNEEYDMLQKQYDDLKKTYEETKEKDAKYAFEMGQNLGQKIIDYNVLKGEYDHLKVEFNKLYSEYLSYMDKIQKFITDIKGEATEKKGDIKQ